MINYTIVIPHYKSINTLKRLLSSIPDRKDIQVIVVDDNSGIERKSFEDLYIYDNIDFSIIYLCSNKGAGGARNEGLAKAVGKWLLFADSDDFFLPSAFDLCDSYKMSNYDIIYFGIRSVNSETLENVDRYKVYNQYIEKYNKNLTSTEDLLRFRHDVPWGKMIKRELVLSNNISFDETRYYNDTMFSTKTAMVARNIAVEKAPLYCVTERMGSLITHKSYDALLIRYNVILRKNKFLREHGKSDYQLPVLSFVRQSFKYGFFAFLRVMYIGACYRTNFFIGLTAAIKSKCLNK